VDDETTRATIEAIKRLDAAFDRGDIDAFMAAMTDDCTWDSFTPAPDGQRHEGQAAVRQAMAEFLGSSPIFDGEEMLACGDRAVMRWTCRFDGGHVRGVDVVRVPRREGRRDSLPLVLECRGGMGGAGRTQLQHSMWPPPVVVGAVLGEDPQVPLA
jgi:ketosteroid isomerase-like protein